MDNTIYADVVIKLQQAESEYLADMNNEAKYETWDKLHRLHSVLLNERQASKVSKVIGLTL